MTVGRLDGVKYALDAAGEDGMIRQQRRRLHGRIGLEGPEFVTGVKPQRMNVPVIGADKNLAAADDSGRFNRAACFVSPEQTGLGGSAQAATPVKAGLPRKIGQSAARTEMPRQHIIKMMPPRKTATNARPIRQLHKYDFLAGENMARCRTFGNQNNTYTYDFKLLPGGEGHRDFAQRSTTKVRS